MMGCMWSGGAGKLLCVCTLEPYLHLWGCLLLRRLSEISVLLQVLDLPGLIWKQLTGEEVSWSKDFPAVDSVLVRGTGRLCLSYSLWHSARW